MPPSSQTQKKMFDSSSLADKVQHKLALQRELGWPAEPKIPVLCLPSGMTDELGGALLKGVLPGIVSQSVQLLIRGKGSSDYGAVFSELQKRYPHRIAIIPNTDGDLEKMYAAADMALFLTPVTTDDAALKQCLRYGVVPLAPTDSEGLENYDPIQESGTAFMFDGSTPWHVFAAFIRALETFKLPFDWRTIQRHGMEMGE